MREAPGGAPVTSISATDIQATGLAHVEDVFNNLPIMFAGQNSTLAAGADGTATVDLRGLGAQRALVLVDGRRLGPGGGNGTNISDINQIPAALIQRIDVLTGGASAIYGADAVAGVMNFILNTRFQGVKVDASYNLYQHHNGDVGIQQLVSGAGQALPPDSVAGGSGKDLSFVLGSNFAADRGNLTVYATHDEVAGIAQGRYDYGACSLRATGAGSYACGGSGVSAGGEFLAFGNSGTTLFDSTVDPGSGRFRPFAASDLYNYSPLNYFLSPNEHYTGGAFLSYDLSSRASAYAQLMFTRNRSQAQSAPSGSFFTSVFVPCNDPLLTADEQAQICSPANLAAQGETGAANPGITTYVGRRNVEGGPRTTTFDSSSLRTLLGLKGAIGAWSYDVYALRGTVHDSSDSLNYFSAAQVANALEVVPGSTGPACATGPPCVPWNIWTPGGVTRAALDYLSIPLHTQGGVTEQVVSGSLTGDLGKHGIRLPATDAGLQLNLGAEWRSERSDFRPDLDSELGNGEGSSGPVAPLSGQFHVSELFAEARLPLRDRSRGAESLALESAYRYSHYSEGFDTNTYKLELQWAPVRELRTHASYQRAIRAPNISELYTPQAVTLDGVTDPCAGATPVYSAAQCASTGVTAAQYGHIGANPAGQYYGLVGGNPRLQPELSDTYTGGLVLEPRMVPELSVALDYFDIRINNVIGPLGADAVLSNCATSGSPVYCSQIHRGPGGSLWLSQSGYVSDVNVNFGSLSSGGIDLTATYRVPLRRLGFLSLALQGTRVENLMIRPQPGAPGYDCTGYFGDKCGAPNPLWRHALEATWAAPWRSLEIALRWRYIGPVASEETSGNPQLAGAVPGGARVPGYNYLDLTTSLALSRHVVLQLGINNLLDKDPPLFIGADCPQISSAPSLSSCSGNTFGAPYDVLGRYIFGHLSAQF
ncbi:MAG TPA: TonB-dependent receptor [Steroidobacteraceae bacterium]|nr:TonB-dependent receptor [Steroidobacteraceae bacterium]